MAGKTAICIKVDVLDPACYPQKQTEGASGYDLHARVGGNLPARGRITLPVGICLELPDDFEGQIRPRSGLTNSGIVACLGTIDSDYRGEVRATIYNHTDYDFPIAQYTRIAQLVIVEKSRVELVRSATLNKTKRGAAGFGSTGL